MKRMHILGALAVLAFAGTAFAQEHEAGAANNTTHSSVVPDVAFAHEGPFGTFDQHQLQRGLQVYTEVCAACHGLKFVAFRTLADESGPGFSEDQVKAYAAGFDVTDAESGEDRPAIPADKFPAVEDAGAPDLSLMAKARAGFHGPMGSGMNQLFRGMGGAEYINAILTGYTGETVEQAGTTLYANTAFPGGWISMPPPLAEDGLVSFADDSPNTKEAMAMDVASFLMWTAEPKMMARKHAGFVAVLFLALIAALLYLTNKRLWAPIKHRTS
jgi:ubiquinol-cytochrome c reductase cytochrome c1 subunit